MAGRGGRDRGVAEMTEIGLDLPLGHSLVAQQTADSSRLAPAAVLGPSSAIAPCRSISWTVEARATTPNRFISQRALAFEALAHGFIAAQFEEQGV